MIGNNVDVVVFDEWFEDVEFTPVIYIAGPMSGIPDFNFPAFMEVADAFREGGWDVINPAEHDLEEWGSLEGIERGFNLDPNGFLRDCLAWDLNSIALEADAIAMLPGWENSKGARTEHALAVALNLQIIYIDQ